MEQGGRRFPHHAFICRGLHRSPSILKECNHSAQGWPAHSAATLPPNRPRTRAFLSPLVSTSGNNERGYPGMVDDPRFPTLKELQPDPSNPMPCAIGLSCSNSFRVVGSHDRRPQGSGPMAKPAFSGEASGRCLSSSSPVPAGRGPQPRAERFNPVGIENTLPCSVHKKEPLSGSFPEKQCCRV